MKKLLIIYPHWIPSNLVGVQRARLISNFLPDFDWQPIILAVNPQFYEEPLTPELQKTVSDKVRVEWVGARPAKRKNRLIGDIALRAYKQLIDGAIHIIEREKIDFIWSPLPSFYTSLIVRKVHDKTGIKYGLDYMDPWVHDFPGGNRILSKPWLAKRVAMILEPIAVKKASLLTGVSELSYLPVIERNTHLKNITTGYMPLGFDKNDYRITPDAKSLIWESDGDILPVMYAGAFLPKSHLFINSLFRVISQLRKDLIWDRRIRFYFIGTGVSSLKSITDYAIEYEIDDIISEKTERISYLEVLYHLSHAFGILAIGNTEPHYTASKIFQALLSERPVFSVFHEHSTVVDILMETNATQYLIKYNENMNISTFESNMKAVLLDYISLKKGWNPNLDLLEDKYSAKESARALNAAINKIR